MLSKAMMERTRAVHLVLPVLLTMLFQAASADFVDVIDNLVSASTGDRGLLILPEDGVPPEAYATYAKGIAGYGGGYFAVVLEKATASHVIQAMMQHPLTQYWCLAGHGKGGVLAAELSRTLQPKVKALVLIGAALPARVDLSSSNILVSVIYFGDDEVVTTKSVTDSFSLIPGDSSTLFLPRLNHYDFTDLACPKGSSLTHCDNFSSASDSDRREINSILLSSLAFAHWPTAGEKALSFGDNAKLAPGHNDSKPYPEEIRVKFEAVPIPGSNPQRMLWVFIPSRVKGGLLYYGGAAVDTRAYWPLAFEIAARGHLVAIPQQSARNALTSYTDANTILDFGLSVLSGVPKGRWAIGGHSLGALAASFFAASFRERIYAFVLHSGDCARNMTDSPVPAMILYGTLDGLLGISGGYWTRSPFYCNLAMTEMSPVAGGNHCQVGDYGFQSGDYVATISSEDQWNTMAERSVAFLDKVAERSLVFQL